MTPITVCGDRVRLQQSVLNLLSNAIKFNKDEGLIKVDIRQCSERSVAIDIIDSGIGIKSENLARMIEPFEQADNSYSRRYEGAGLGLSVVQKIMKLHGGELRLKSVYGKGTCASIHLPHMASDSLGHTNSFKPERLQISKPERAA